MFLMGEVPLYSPYHMHQGGRVTRGSSVKGLRWRSEGPRPPRAPPPP